MKRDSLINILIVIAIVFLLVIFFAAVLSPQAHGQTAPAVSHSFLDAVNATGFTYSAVGITLDSLSTQKVLEYGGTEKDPLFRSMVKTRAGNVLAGGLLFGGLTGAMYALHKTRHHAIERILPFFFGGMEVGVSIHNYRLANQLKSSR